MDFQINGRPVTVDVDLRTSLLDLLRDHLGLTGTKKGCNQGACGACTVLVDGERIISCLALAVQYQGREITTVEGLADGDGLHPLQQAFIEHDGFQCGYCTPGQICSAIGMAAEVARGVPSHVTDDLAAETIALEPRRTARAHERQPVPLRRLQRHRRRDRRDLRRRCARRRVRAGEGRMNPFTYSRAGDAAAAIRDAAQRRRQVPRRRHQPGRPDARERRAAARWST